MKRRLMLLGLAAAMAGLAGPANAGMSPGEFDNQYQGRVASDPSKYFGFDVVKKRGERKIARVTAHAAYSCDNGKGGSLTARVRGKLKVEDDRFADTLRATVSAPTRFAPRGSSDFRVKYKVKGAFKTRRKAKGTLDAELRFSAAPRGDAVRCYSGEVSWKAKRGAEVTIPS